MQAWIMLSLSSTFDRRQKSVDKTPTAKSANPDLITQCIKAKMRHNSVSVKIVQYHKSPLLIETHDMATEAMAKTRKEYRHDIKSFPLHQPFQN